MTTRFIVDCGDHLITHDGYMQLGIFQHSLKEHLRLNPQTKWQLTYWMPDIFMNRYKRVSFQKHILKNEGSPPTDNSTSW